MIISSQNLVRNYRGFFTSGDGCWQPIFTTSIQQWYESATWGTTWVATLLGVSCREGVQLVRIKVYHLLGRTIGCTPRGHSTTCLTTPFLGGFTKFSVFLKRVSFLNPRVRTNFCGLEVRFGLGLRPGLSKQLFGSSQEGTKLENGLSALEAAPKVRWENTVFHHPILVPSIPNLSS